MSAPAKSYSPLGWRTAQEAGKRLRAGEPIDEVAASVGRDRKQLRQALRAWGIRYYAAQHPAPSVAHPHPAKAPLAPRITTLPYDDPKAAIRAIERQRIAEEKA